MAGRDKKSALLALAIACLIALLIYNPDLMSPEMLPSFDFSTLLPTGGEATPTETTDEDAGSASMMRSDLPKAETSQVSEPAGTDDLEEVKVFNSNTISEENFEAVAPSAQAKAKETEEPHHEYADDDPWGEEVTPKAAATIAQGVVVSDEVRQVGGSDMEPEVKSRSSEPR